MSSVPMPLPPVDDAREGFVAASPPPARLRVVSEHSHDWRLRETEYEDGYPPVRRLECLCGDVTFA